MDKACIPVHIIVALMAEAKPLIRHFNLLRVENTYPFSLYQNDWLSLIVSGIGKSAAASACGFLQHSSQAQKDHVWLNIGISGAKNAELGSLWLAHKVVEHSSGATWYPQFVMPTIWKRTTVTTVDQAELVKHDDTLYDMEAAGFCAACSRFSSMEFVHVAKIVSDNQNHHFSHVNASTVEAWFNEQLPAIEAIIMDLDRLNREHQALYQNPPDLTMCLERWHFTVTQKNQLAELLRRWSLLCPNQEIWPIIDSLTQTKKVLHTLRQRVEEAALEALVE